MKRILRVFTILMIVSFLWLITFALNIAAFEKTDLEVASFQGGYGIDWLEKISKEYEELHPNVKVKVWGNPRVWEQLRPRFVAGTPPDVCAPGWGFDFWAAIYENKIRPLDEALNSKAYDQDEMWKEIFIGDLLAVGKWEGKHYIMPLFLNVFGWWYNKALFEKNGWKVPKTWSELLILAEKIKGRGIAPFTTQGIYPDYAVFYHFLYPALRIGGLKAFKDAVNLKPGAWKSAAFLKSAQIIREFVDKEYFQKGCLGMNHTGAQMEWLAGRAAIIGCGSWLQSEMVKVTPEDFEMRYMRVPAWEGGAGDPTTVMADSDMATNWIVPMDGKHPEIAFDFLKFMTSLENAKMIATSKSAILTIKGSGGEEITDETLLGTVKALTEAKKTVMVDSVIGAVYPTLKKIQADAIAALLGGEITPEQCVEKIEKEAERIRGDKTIPKHLF